MLKAYVVAQREYRTQVRSKAFIISLVLIPLLMGSGVLVPQLLEGRVKVEDQRVAVADATGRVLAGLVAAAEVRNRKEIFDSKGRQTEPRFIIEAAPAPSLTDVQRLELSQQVRKRHLFAFIEVDAAAFVFPPPAKSGRAPVRIHTEGAPFGGLNRWSGNVINQAVQAERLRAAGLDAALVARATARLDIAGRGLYQRNADNQIVSADERSRNASTIFPMVVLALTFFAIMMSQTMLQSTLEEKQQRIAEVLLGSTRPGVLMLGKVTGSAAVSLTTIVLYLSGGVWLLAQFGLLSLLRNEMVAWLLLFVVLGVIIYGSLFAMVGAACSELKEAQTYLMPLMILLTLPMMVFPKILQAPTSGFATVLSFVPLFTPMLMPLRLAATEAVPLWQPIVATFATLATAILAVWAGGRVLRIGLLLQGKAPSLRQLFGWIVHG